MQNGHYPFREVNGIWYDEDGPILTIPARFDAGGRLLPYTEEEMRTRDLNRLRLQRIRESLPEEPDPPGSFEDLMIRLGMNPDGSSRRDP